MEHALRLAEQDASEWQSLLREHRLAMTRPSEEQLALSCGFRPTHGAPPDEVRAVLVLLSESLGPGDQERLTEHLHRRYLTAIRPRSSVAGIFANAAATSLRATVAAGQVESRRCERCGAGRQNESELERCGFCGHSFGECS